MHATITHLTDATILPLARLYAACFREAPWFEEFLVDDVVHDFHATLDTQGSVILCAQIDDMVVGGTVGLPLRFVDAVARVLPAPCPDDYYFAELFVDAKCRRYGIADALITARSAFARTHGYTTAVVRTSVEQMIIQNLYRARGFETIVEHAVVSTKVVDGVATEAPDMRVVLRGTI